MIHTIILQLDEFPPDLYSLKQLQVVADDDDNVLSGRRLSECACVTHMSAAVACVVGVSSKNAIF